MTALFFLSFCRWSALPGLAIGSGVGVFAAKDPDSIPGAVTVARTMMPSLFVVAFVLSMSPKALEVASVLGTAAAALTLRFYTMNDDFRRETKRRAAVEEQSKTGFVANSMDAPLGILVER